MTDTPSTEPDAATVTPDQPAQAQPAAAAPRDADAPLGGPGLKALREERAARERLEQAMTDQRTALLAAFGVKSETAGEDIVTTLQKQVNAMQRDNLVNTVARRHGITDDDDLELLRGIPDETAMARLAQRLKAATTAPPTLEPDRAQGAQSPAKSAEDAQYEAFFPTHS